MGVAHKKFRTRHPLSEFLDPPLLRQDQDSKGDHQRQGGTVCSTIHGPRGTIFSAVDPVSAADVPGGPILGETNYRMTDIYLVHFLAQPLIYCCRRSVYATTTCVFTFVGW